MYLAGNQCRNIHSNPSHIRENTLQVTKRPGSRGVPLGRVYTVMPVGCTTLNCGAFLSRSVQAAIRNHKKLAQQAAEEHNMDYAQLEQSSVLRELKPTHRDAASGHQRWRLVFAATSSAILPSWPLVKKIAEKVGMFRTLCQRVTYAACVPA
jgi:hypothetical protein